MQPRMQAVSWCHVKARGSNISSQREDMSGGWVISGLTMKMIHFWELHWNIKMTECKKCCQTPPVQWDGRLKGSNQPYFGSTGILSAVAMGDKVAQTNVAHQRWRPTHETRQQIPYRSKQWGFSEHFPKLWSNAEPYYIYWKNTRMHSDETLYRPLKTGFSFQTAVTVPLQQPVGCRGFTLQRIQGKWWDVKGGGQEKMWESRERRKQSKNKDQSGALASAEW